MPPASAITSRTGVPRAISYTPGRRAAPQTVTSADPGADAVPTQRNQLAPQRLISARLARVSTLLTRVGRPRTPRSNGRGGVNPGKAGPPLRYLTREDSALATYRSGTRASSTGTGSYPARSATAAASASACAGRRTHRYAARAAVASAARAIPSSTR